MVFWGMMSLLYNTSLPWYLDLSFQPKRLRPRNIAKASICNTFEATKSDFNSYFDNSSICYHILKQFPFTSQAFWIGFGKPDYNRKDKLYSHEGLVVAADFLNMDIVFAIDVGFCRRITVGNGHHTGNVLEIVMVIYLNLK